jgi:mRNA-degrading endonuclease RelE of RelBE toxin-antitoxin system
MRVEVGSKVWKEIDRTPIHIQLMVVEQLEKLKAANCLSELNNVERLKGTDEPYFRLKFNKYRIIFYYDDATNYVDVRQFKHRKDAY